MTVVALARKNAQALGAGHAFIVFLGEGYYPVNVLNAVKMVPEVCRIFCATANATEVIPSHRYCSAVALLMHW